MILCFTLSMPGVASWNGRWSGEGRLYAKVINLGKSQKADLKGQELIKGSPYRYFFGDGWVASVSVREVDAKETAKIRRKSQGFCGYDWMIDSIRYYGMIKTK